jgi:hypothetical protein
LSLAGVVSAAPDDQMFRHLAQTYAANHRTMHRGNICEGDNFKGKRVVISAAPNDQIFKAFSLLTYASNRDPGSLF